MVTTTSQPFASTNDKYRLRSRVQAIRLEFATNINGTDAVAGSYLVIHQCGKLEVMSAKTLNDTYEPETPHSIPQGPIWREWDKSIPYITNGLGERV